MNIMEKIAYEVRVDDEDKKQHIFIIQSEVDENISKKLLTTIGYGGDISIIENNIMGDYINKIVQEMNLRKLRVINIKIHE